MNIPAVLHLHSTYSYDGSETLDSIKHALQERGISVACMTEHVEDLSPDRAREFIQECGRLSDENFLLIPGFEIPYLGTHILVVGADQFLWDGNPEQSLDAWVKHGALAIVAHPHRNGFIFDEFMQTNTVGMEIWNSQYDGKLAPRRSSVKTLRKLQTRHQGYLAFGSIDMHRLHHIGGPELVFEVSELTVPRVLDTLRHGQYELQRAGVAISSHGDVIRGSISFSMLSVSIVTVGKNMSRIFKILGLHNVGPIRWLRRKVRQRI